MSRACAFRLSTRSLVWKQGAGGGGASDDDAADLEGLEREPADADGDDDYMDVVGGAKKPAAKGKAGGKGGRGRGGARGGARGGRGGRGAAKPRRRPQLGEDTWVDEDEVEEEPEEDEGRGGGTQFRRFSCLQLTLAFIQPSPCPTETSDTTTPTWC